MMTLKERLKLWKKIAQQGVLPGIEEPLPPPRTFPAGLRREELEEVNPTMIDRRVTNTYDPYDPQYNEPKTLFPEANRDWSSRYEARRYTLPALPTPRQIAPLGPEHLFPVQYTRQTVPQYSYDVARGEPGSEKIQPEYTEEQKEDRDKLLKVYNRFRNYYSVFYRAYLEANKLMEEGPPTPNLDKMKTEDILRLYATYASQSLKPALAKLFGEKKEVRGLYGSERDALQNILRGHPLTNLQYIYHPEKDRYYYWQTQTQTNIKQLHYATQEMKRIVDDFERLKRMQNKAEKEINKTIDLFLSVKENRALLRWIDKKKPEAKKLLLEQLSYVTNPQNVELLLDQNIKTFRRVYDAMAKTIISPTQKIRTTFNQKLEGEMIAEAQARYQKITDEVLNLIHLETAPLKNGKEGILHVVDIPQADLAHPDTHNAIEESYQRVIEYLKNRGFNLAPIENYIKQKGSMTNVKDEPMSNEAALSIFKLAFLLLLNEERTVAEPTRSDFSAQTIKTGLTAITPEQREEMIKNGVHHSLKHWLGVAMANFGNLYYRVSRDVQPYLPDLQPLSALVDAFGSLSPGDIYKQVIPKLGPEIKPDLAFQFVRFLFRNNKLNDLLNGQYEVRQDLKLLAKALDAVGKLDLNMLLKYYQTNIPHQIKHIYQLLPNRFEKRIPEIIARAVRSPATLEQDLNTLEELSNTIHNSASNLPPRLLELMLTNPNLRQLRNVDMVKKLYNIAIRIGGLGGLAKFQKTYAKTIAAAKSRKLVSRQFIPDLKRVLQLFTSDTLISPAMPNASEMSALFNKVNSEIELVAELNDYMGLYEQATEVKKIPELFKLNFKVNDRLRFRVLKDLDPMYFKVGRETNCCQYPGGAGGAAAEDSFINPQAGVVVLEWLNPQRQWVILSQSYFHYVKRDKGYILDNVETNGGRVGQSGIPLEKVYAYWAQHMKDKLKLNYFQAGQGYTDLDSEDEFFERERFEGRDPRSFSVGSPYTDWKPHNRNLNLLKTQVKLDKLDPQKWGQTEPEEENYYKGLVEEE